MKKLQNIYLFLVLIIGLSQLAEAKNLFVNNSAANCSDLTSYAANTASAPWCSIGRAAWGTTNPNAGDAVQAAQAGDLVLISAGNYITTGPQTTCRRWGVALNPANSGTESLPIIFRGSGVVNIYLGQGYRGPTIGADSRNFIVWDNVRIDEQVALGLSCADTGPVVIHESTGSQIVNSRIRGTNSGWNDNYSGIRLEATNRILVANNEIFEFTGPWGHNDAGIMTYDTANSIIEHNLIHSNPTGIFIKGDHAGDAWPQQNNIIRYNRIENCSNKSVFTIAGNGSRIYQNIIRQSQGFAYRHDGSNVSDITFANNTIIKTGTSNAVGFSVSSVAPTVSNFRVFNNIFFGSFSESINLGDTPSIGGQSFEHNIYYGFMNFGSLNGAFINFETWKNSYNKDRLTPISLNIDPQFADVIQYKLQAGSPARTVGIDLLDLNSNGLITDVISAGAYISGNETIGITSNALPPVPMRLTAPRNLRLL